MSFFITLIESTDASRRELEAIPKMNSMINRGLTLAEYKAFLHDLYYIVWHFCPIMGAAASRCDDRFRNVRYELYERIDEEKNHETWVLEDIEAVGGDVARVRANPPSPPVQAMVAFNYYCADRAHPCSVLGMLYSLEVIASAYAATLAQSIAKTLGRDMDGPGFKFLLSHSAMDQEHVAKLNVLVKTIDDPVAQESIMSATRVNFYQFGRMFYEGGFSTLIAG
ncbi:MAG TPA: iron-containing redox enzyme family protein [Burkholderiales bacterium]|nr:iron-containing redox enzyme family protein [Burkholderiales bacterium]